MLRTVKPVSEASCSIVRPSTSPPASQPPSAGTALRRALIRRTVALACVTSHNVTSNGVTFVGVRVDAGMNMLTTLAQSTPPAGGAAIHQIVIATVGAMIVTGALLALGMGRRPGRLPLLGRLAGFSERGSGIPGWAALPAAIISGALIIALFGMLWDISLHIDDGRDEGPL